jgi:hypothetical protein
VRNFANDCFIDNNIVWRHIKRQFKQRQVVIFLPQALVDNVFQDRTHMVISLQVTTASKKQKKGFSNVITGRAWMPTSAII